MEDNKFSKLTASAIPDSDALMEDSREAEIMALKNRIELLEELLRQAKNWLSSPPIDGLDKRYYRQFQNSMNAALRVKS